MLNENDALREENSALKSLVDTATWQQEREELLNALGFEKENVKHWEKESNAIRGELKDLRQVAKSLETKDTLIAEMQEEVDQLRSDLEDAQAKVGMWCACPHAGWFLVCRPHNGNPWDLMQMGVSMDPSTDYHDLLLQIRKLRVLGSSLTIVACNHFGKVTLTKRFDMLPHAYSRGIPSSGRGAQ